VADSTTHVGTPEVALTFPPAINNARMMPIVFCASLAPWPRSEAARRTRVATNGTCG
jgi:hypothetical protein